MSVEHKLMSDIIHMYKGFAFGDIWKKSDGLAGN